MKKRFTILMAVIALLAIFAIPMGMMGQTSVDVTLSSGSYNNNVITWTCADGNITIQQQKGSSLTAVNSSYISAPRVYKQHILSFVGNNGYTITNIDIKCDGSYYGTTKYAGTEISDNNVDNNSTALNPTWSTANGGTHSIATVSNDGLSEIYIQNGHSSDNNSQLRITKLTITYKVTGSVTATTVTINTDNLTNTDVYSSTTAGSLSATVTETESGDAVSGASVTWSSSNTDVATIANDGTVTLVAVGTTTITASYAGESGVYGSATATYELTVTSSEPYDQPTVVEITPNYEFWGKTGQFSGNTYSELSGEQDNVSLDWSKGNGSTYANSTAMRFYKDNTLVFTAPTGYEIISIEITFTQTQSDLVFSPTGYDSSTSTWTGASTTVTMSRPSGGSSYYQITKFKITLSLPSSDPSISANDVNIAYDATSGEIEYTLNNPSENGSLSVSENVDWISNAVLSTTESKVTFNATANEATTSRSGVITLTYTYGNNNATVTKDVTVTQDGAPLIYTTIPALFNDATSTATDVNITFGSWVISAVHNSNAYLTDNQGNGLIIYASDHGFQVNDVLTGTVSCKLQIYRGSAELTNLTTSTSGLTVTPNGTITEQSIAINNLSGVNTGALVAYEGLTYNGTTLEDGDGHTITPYSTLYSYSFENGKTYNVTGIYLQYNSTKEILPRSAADIEEVQVPHNEYTLTVSNLSHVDLFVFDNDDPTTAIISGEGSAQVYDGTEIMISVDVEEGYVIESLIVDGDDVTNQIDAANTYTFTMPTHAVTITASAEVLTGDPYELYSGALVEGDYLIVYGGKAMNNTVSSNRLQYNEVVAINNVITTDNAEIVWHIAQSGAYWTIFSADANAYAASTGTKNQATTIADGTDDKALWSITIAESKDDTYEFVNKYNADNNINSNLRENTTYGFACYAASTGGALSLYKKVETPTETYPLDIAGYINDDATNGWYLIASPVMEDITPAAGNGFITSTYDLYRFNPTANKEWENWKTEGDHYHFPIEHGRGYLYASKTATTLQFTGTPHTDSEVTLAYTGWNLIGNPSNIEGTISESFYVMNDDHNDLVAAASGRTVHGLEGIFVYGDENDVIVFEEQPAKRTISQVTLNIVGSNGNVIDRAIVNFDSNNTMTKLMLDESNTKIYIPQSDADYAVVSSNGQGNMPVNFKAARTGKYTLRVDTEGIDMSYMHIIDRFTGEDVNVLLDNEYSFIASQSDVADRFILSFNENGYNADANETFAFQNGSDVIVNGNGELQVFDVTGRMVMNTMINGIQNVNMPNGVYVFRMIGETVKTQKIVVR